MRIYLSHFCCLTVALREYFCLNFCACDTCTGREKNGSLSRESSWCNPLLNPLPKAPSMSIYCFGSRAFNTEVAYLMKDQRPFSSCSITWSRPISTIIRNALGHNLLETTSGDQTIPWLSQTLMCSGEEVHGLRGWIDNPELNPGKVQASAFSATLCHACTSAAAC